MSDLKNATDEQLQERLRRADSLSDERAAILEEMGRRIADQLIDEVVEKHRAERARAAWRVNNPRIAGFWNKRDGG